MEIKVVTTEGEWKSGSSLGYPAELYSAVYAHKYDNDIVIRWGCSRSLYNRYDRRNMDFKNVINPSAAIKRNCQKHSATTLLSQVVNVPTLWMDAVPAGVVAVVRPFEHSAGAGFSVKKGPFKLEPETYATRYIQTDAEYRVWFCGNRTMVGRRVKMKINEEEEGSPKFVCRSKWGYEFCRGICRDLHNQTLLAAKKIGLDFGAADILYHNGKWIFLELNSAPSVDHRIVREFFQIGFKNLIASKFPSNTETLVPVVEIKPKVNIPVESVVRPAVAPIRSTAIRSTGVKSLLKTIKRTLI